MEQLNIFLLFPESDDEILAMGDDCSRYLDIPKQLSLIKAIVKKHNHRFFYDSKNVTKFCAKAVDLCENTYLDNIRNQLLSLLNKNATDTVKLPLFKSDCSYYQWNELDASVCLRKDGLIKSAFECGEKTIVLSFLYQDSWHRSVLPIIKDASHYQGLPMLINIPYFNPIGTFIEWYNAHLSNRPFQLSDVIRFERTNKVWHPSKQRIYKERETARYWYYDFFHRENKEHYEVFDSDGNHIGEANCNGIVDESKKDGNKSISSIL
jgi:hypothetical protein